MVDTNTLTLIVSAIYDMITTSFILHLNALDNKHMIKLKTLFAVD